MLEANKSTWFEKIFTVYNRSLIKRKFNSLRVRNFDNLTNKNPGFPLITYANHSNWWDGLILFELFSHFEVENFVLMEEKQLKDLPLFRKLGAFSIVRENPKEALKSINYSVEQLRNNSKANLWIFPQGEIQPNDLRPLFFYSGISRIIQKAGKCCVVPIALRFEFLNDFKPDIFLKIGQINYFDKITKSKSKTLPEEFRKEMENLLDGLKEDVLSGNLNKYINLI